MNAKKQSRNQKKRIKSLYTVQGILPFNEKKLSIGKGRNQPSYGKLASLATISGNTVPEINESSVPKMDAGATKYSQVILSICLSY